MFSTSTSARSTSRYSTSRPSGGLEVEGDATACFGAGSGSRRSALRSPPPQQILRSLHPDDLGAPVGELADTGGAGPGNGQVKDPDVGEGEIGHLSLLRAFGPGTRSLIPTGRPSPSAPLRSTVGYGPGDGACLDRARLMTPTKAARTQAVPGGREGSPIARLETDVSGPTPRPPVVSPHLGPRRAPTGESCSLPVTQDSHSGGTRTRLRSISATLLAPTRRMVRSMSWRRRVSTRSTPGRPAAAKP